MTVPSETIWPLDPHTAAKHEILKLYLQRWFPGLLARIVRRMQFSVASAARRPAP